MEMSAKDTIEFQGRNEQVIIHYIRPTRIHMTYKLPENINCTRYGASGHSPNNRRFKNMDWQSCAKKGHVKPAGVHEQTAH